MTGGAVAARLPDGRLHLHHGPIDLVITAEGPGRADAFQAAEARFATILSELTPQLPVLTSAFHAFTPNCPVAERMQQAVAPLAADRFVTSMAAVAGAVADEVCASLVNTDLSKAVVNNGGDIAFFLTDGQTFRSASPHGLLAFPEGAPVRGIATSGWRGRSQSLGIADAVTVLAPHAARADAAATLIANAVDLPGHPAITRRPASEVEAIPQLGTRPVTVDVGPLTVTEIDTALTAGAAYAKALVDRGVILGALLRLNGQSRIIASSDIGTALPADPS